MTAVHSGRVAEELVSKYLAHQGWEVAARNFRRHGFELDVIAVKDRVLLACEVKYRKNFDPDSTGRNEVIQDQQIRRIVQGLKWYIGISNHDIEQIQVDLFVVSGKEKNWLYRYSQIHLY